MRWFGLGDEAEDEAEDEAGYFLSQLLLDCAEAGLTLEAPPLVALHEGISSAGLPGASGSPGIITGEDAQVVHPAQREPLLAPASPSSGGVGLAWAGLRF